PVHILIVPKKHISSVDQVDSEDKEMLGELILTAQKIARDLTLNNFGYKLIFNVGRGGGQLIDHLHLHLLGGWKGEGLKELP
ncbi:MAG: HIT domain-containing protein, partial [bacterium]|nr:HIT domain-containing protein [bacterium]